MTDLAGTTTRAVALATRPVFETAAGTRVDWAEVVVQARHAGSWADAQHRARLGTAALARAEEEGDPLPGGALRDGIRSYRYERGLLAADDFRTWIDERGLHRDDVVAHVHGRVLAAHWAGDEASLLAAWAPPDAELDHLALLDARCDGVLAVAARDAAGRIAVVEQRTGRPAPSGAELTASYDEITARHVTDERIERAVRSRQLEWTRLGLRIVELTDDAAAREARLCIVRDGLPIDELATMAGTQVIDIDALASELAPAVVAATSTTAVGEVTEPVDLGSCHAIVLVATKAPPSLGDAAVADRAAQAVIAAMVESAVARSVRWLDVL